MLQLLQENLILNKRNNCEVLDFDWTQPSEIILAKQWDIIFGSDLVYDPLVIDEMVEMLGKLSFSLGLFACTIRNQETFDYFIGKLTCIAISHSFLDFTPKLFPSSQTVKIVQIRKY